MALRLASNSRGVVNQARERYVAPETLFTALDGREVTVSGRRWEMEIYSICDQAGRRWIQLAVKGQPQYMLTLKLSTEDGVRHAILALSSWLANPADAHEILNVA